MFLHNSVVDAPLVEGQTDRNRVVLIDDPYHDWNSDCVEFRLTYAGQLLASGNERPGAEAGRARHKQEIRKVFLTQLKRLWNITPSLKSMLDTPAEIISVNRTDRTTRQAALPERYRCGNYRLLPLVTKDLGLFVGIDVLFLRPDPPGVLIRSGDIDNRLKTLFDALRMPGPDSNELGGLEPASDENPFYCLLEDDRLISKVSIETDLLLEPSDESRRNDANDTRLIITVKLKPTDASTFATQHFI